MTTRWRPSLFVPHLLDAAGLERKTMPATTPEALTYGDGDFAIDAAHRSPGRVQTVLVDAQWIVLALPGEKTRCYFLASNFAPHLP